MNTAAEQANAEVIRAFIAMAINEKIRAELAEIQQQLRKAGARVSWVPPQNIHCTLVFLGDIFADTIDALAAALNQASVGCKPFEVEVKGLGFFGSSRSPRVIWVGMAGATAPLVKLQGDIVNAALAAGLQPDQKPFRPHLTIGRVRFGRGAEALVKLIEKYSHKSFGVFAVKQIVLMKSRLTSHGPVYAPLHAVVFEG